MPLALVRIDARLIHGQIIEAWVPYLKLNCILVADDAVASNVFQVNIMKMAVPRKIEIAVKGLREAADCIQAGKWEGKKVLVILSDCESAYRIHYYGLKFPSLNVGNIHYSLDRTQVTPSICLNHEDISYLRKLEEEGVEVEFRTVPRQKPIRLSQIKMV
jgi:PTS system mannose-specific IIB component